MTLLLILVRLTLIREILIQRSIGISHSASSDVFQGRVEQASSNYLPLARNYLDVDRDDSAVSSELDQASVVALRSEQIADESLAACWNLAKRNKGDYLVCDGLLFRCEKIFWANI